MATRIKEPRSIGDQIRDHFKKTQSWLAKQIGISEGQLSKKIHNKVDWRQDELDKVNKALGTSFKLDK